MSDAKLIAAAIRKELKALGVTASVRKRDYTCVQVTVRQDVTPEIRTAVEGICSKYKAGRFDGMTDCYEFDKHDDDLPRCQYVFVNFDYSAELIARVDAYVADRFQGLDTYESNRVRWNVLTGQDGEDFWAGAA